MIYNEEPNGEDFVINIKTVLAFATGADHPPPMGFPNPPQIMFEVASDRTLPTASTCGPTIYLPLSMSDPDRFCEKMDFAICCAQGFGNP